MATKIAVLGGSLAVFAVVIVTLNLAATRFTQGSCVFEFPGLTWKLHMPSYEGRSANFSQLWKRAKHELEARGVNVYFFSIICLVLGIFLAVWFESKRTGNSSASKSAHENPTTSGYVKTPDSLTDPLTDRPLQSTKADSILSHHAAADSLNAVEKCEGEEDEVDRVSVEEQAALHSSSIAQQPEPLQESNSHTQQQRDSDITPWAELLFGKASFFSRGLIARLDLRKEHGVLVTALVHTLGFLQVALRPFFPDQNVPESSSRDDDAKSEDVPGVVKSGEGSSATDGVRCAGSVRLGLLAVLENNVRIVVPPPVPQRPLNGGPCI